MEKTNHEDVSVSPIYISKKNDFPASLVSFPEGLGMQFFQVDGMKNATVHAAKDTVMLPVTETPGLRKRHLKTSGSSS